MISKGHSIAKYTEIGKDAGKSIKTDTDQKVFKSKTSIFFK